jgi:creatinine amidohydrolase
MSRALHDLAWPEVERIAPSATLAIPVGATEQHGPHLPLSTDTDIAVALVAGLGLRRPGVLAAPPIAYGSSGEHAGFAGTLSVGREAIALLLIELVRAASATFPRVVLVCAHGGNAEPIRRAEQLLIAERREVRVFFPGWSGDAHAGLVETSLMLALEPSRVDLGRAVPGVTTPLPELMPRLIEGGVASVSASGVLGDPRGASAESGRRMLESAVDELVELVDWTSSVSARTAGRAT